MSALAEPVTFVDAGAADRRGISLLAVAHVVNDANQSALPAILPFLIAHRGLSLAVAATLVLAMNLSSSVVQPLFGYWSDRRSMAWVIPASVVVACCGTAAIGLAPTLPLMLLAALVAGIGVAGFHPEGSRFANYFAGSQRAVGMSWFSVGGYGGFALGPILVTPLLLAFGMHGTVFLIVPGLIVAGFLARDLPRFERARRDAQRQRAAHAGVDDWRGFAILSAVVAVRSATFFAGVTFLPLFAIAVMHADNVQGSAALAAMLLTGVGGTLLGGRIADRRGRRRVVVLSTILTSMAAAAIAFAGAHVVSLPLLFLLAAAFGFSVSLSASVLVVLGQEYLPSRIGVASGMTLGLSVTIGGLAAPMFGAIGDHYGLVTVFLVVTGFAILAFLGSLFLPRLRREARPA
jgi:FSR family fosmidomycin resistance protein-like MFS transporter